MSSSHETILDRVERLSLTGSIADARSMLGLLTSDESRTRFVAADAIGAIVRGAEASAETDQLLDELIGLVGEGTQAPRTVPAMVALEGVGKMALPRLAAAIGRAPAALRISLLGVVGTIGGVNAVKILEPFVASDDSQIAIAAAEALGRTRDSSATEILIENLAARDALLRVATIRALGALGDDRGVEHLEAQLTVPAFRQAVVSSLVEIGSIAAVRALTRHLKSADGKLQPAILSAAVTLARDDRPKPAAIARAILKAARDSVGSSIDSAAFEQIGSLLYSSDTREVRSAIIAMGWSGDPRALPFVCKFVSDPSFGETARRALQDLAENPIVLSGMIDLPSAMISANDLAFVIRTSQSLIAMELAAQLIVNLSEPDSMEVCVSVLRQGREWLRQQRPEEIEGNEVANLINTLRAKLAEAHGRVLVEIASTLGALVAFIQPAMPLTIAEFDGGESEDSLVARLAFLDAIDPDRAAEEATAALRSRSAMVRIYAIELLSWRPSLFDKVPIAFHLADEEPGVRLAAAQAIRRGPASNESRSALFAALADSDTLVRSEAIRTLGSLFGLDGDIHRCLTESLDSTQPLCRVAAAQALSKVADREDWKRLGYLAHTDQYTEARLAAVQAFANCTDSQLVFNVIRGALDDPDSRVRYAAVELVSGVPKETAVDILLGVTAKTTETPSVRGAALRAVAKFDAARSLGSISSALAEDDSTMVEDGYSAMAEIVHSSPSEIEKIIQSCPPRIASIIRFILAN
jgi:HEAT repeat protein